MKLFLAFGHYAFATPCFAAQYTLDHMRLEPSLKANITPHYYEAGHMMYIDKKSLSQLKKDVSAFLNGAMANQ